MSNYADIINASLENYYYDRLNKIIALKNILFYKEVDEEQELLCCDTLIVMLYAQLEGFFTDALLFYSEEINKQKLLCKNVKHCFAVATAEKEFNSLDYSDFKGANQGKYDRRIKFMGDFHNILDRIVDIPMSYINTESNLNNDVIHKLMKKLGFIENKEAFLFKDELAIIKTLVDRRNDIAHGAKGKEKIYRRKYENIEDIIINKVMKKLKSIVLDSLLQQKYLFSHTSQS